VTVVPWPSSSVQRGQVSGNLSMTSKTSCACVVVSHAAAEDATDSVILGLVKIDLGGLDQVAELRGG
jgi:hypothetical protein